MQKHGSDKPPLSPSFKRLAVSITVTAAVVFYLGFERFKLAPDRQKQAQDIEYAEPATEKAENRIELPSAPAPEKTAAVVRAEKVLKELTREFPHGILDCMPEPGKAAESVGSPKESGENPTIMSMIESTSSVIGKSLEDIDRIERIYMQKSQLDNDIEQLRGKNPPETIVPLFKYMASLNPGMGAEQTEESVGLANFFSLSFNQGNNVYIEAVPSFACMAKFAYMEKTMNEVAEALAGSLLRNPRSAGPVLNGLPEPQRLRVLNDCVESIFSDDLDMPQADRFFSALPAAAKTQFIAILVGGVFSEEQVASAEKAAAYTSNPQLREAIIEAIPKWKEDIESIKKDLADDLAEDPNDSENDNQEPENQE